ncbi:hypothetical protein [Photobacterium sp. TY1-4]|nr:hypothetical protein [Photobacterium sp. TY1-4]UXI00385.1 hypothetical protein NH461_11235 [Photobacterium sp. TY1-4]
MNHETQRHLDTVRAKFIKQYQREQPKPAQQAMTAQVIGLVDNEYR